MPRARLSIGVVLSIVLLVGIALVLTHRAEASTICWSGGGSDTNWSDAGNWKGGVVPGSSDIAEFDNTTDCPIGTYPNANKNATIDTTVTVAGISIKHYSGTITQGAGNSVTVGSSNYSQSDAASTFTGSTSGDGMQFVAVHTPGHNR